MRKLGYALLLLAVLLVVSGLTLTAHGMRNEVIEGLNSE